VNKKDQDMLFYSIIFTASTQ